MRGQGLKTIVSSSRYDSFEPLSSVSQLPDAPLLFGSELATIDLRSLQLCEHKYFLPPQAKERTSDFLRVCEAAEEERCRGTPL